MTLVVVRPPCFLLQRHICPPRGSGRTGRTSASKTATACEPVTNSCCKWLAETGTWLKENGSTGWCVLLASFQRWWYGGGHSCLPSSWPGFDSRPSQATVLTCQKLIINAHNREYRRDRKMSHVLTRDVKVTPFASCIIFQAVWWFQGSDGTHGIDFWFKWNTEG